MSPFLHQQLTKSLLEEMSSGSWRQGQRFLSLNDIKRLWKVSEPTASRSLRELSEHGLLQASWKRGHFLQSGFQSKAQILLRRNRTPHLPPPITLEQKARLLKKVKGGKIALLLERNGPLDFTEHATVPEGLLPQVHNLSNVFIKECTKYGFEVRCFVYGYHDRPYDWIRDLLDKGNFSGAAVFCRSSHLLAESMLEPLIRKHLPIVIMYDDCQGKPVHSINLNNVGLGYDAIRILYRMGHRKIAILSKHGVKRHQERIKGCLLARDQGGCRDTTLHVLRTAYGKPLSVATRRYLSNPKTRPTAIFAADSGTLNHVGDFLKQKSIAIPEDISLILYGNQEGVTGFDTPLDSMELKHEEKIGRIAARQLHRIQSGEALEKSLLVNIPYIARGSVKRILPKSSKKKRIPPA